MANVFWNGIHRGFLAIFQELKVETLGLYEPDCLLADPKPDRAQKMAVMLKERFPILNPHPLTMRVEDALVFSRDHDSVVLALDDIAATSAALQARRPSQRFIFQITGRGPGGVIGTHIAIQGTLTPGDKQTDRSVSLLLPALGEMSHAASSRELTGPDPLTAAVLQPFRTVISRRTSVHLGEKNHEPRELTGSPLSLTFGHTLLPLIAVEGQALEKYSQQTALALESAGELPVSPVITAGQSSCMVVVALVIPHERTVHFMRVSLTKKGRRRVAGVATFAPQRDASSEVLFTD